MDATTKINDNHQSPQLPKWFSVGMMTLMAVLGPTLSVNSNNLPSLTVPVASADSSRVVGELKGSGLVFKVRVTRNKIMCHT